MTLRWLALAVGVAILLGTIRSIVGTLVVPRMLSSRLSTTVGRLVGIVLRAVSRLVPSFERKDRLLALYGPVWLLTVLVTWMVLLWIGFGLLIWRFSPGGVWPAFEESGASLLTLGFSAPRGRSAALVHFAAAATGLVVIALQIAYLPVLYGAFNRRETLVTTLESRAGLPAWGPELLWRHQNVRIMDNLGPLFSAWEEWAADLAETHTTYPVLIQFRSPHPLRSWITGLLAVMDAAAMYQALCPTTSPSETRLCLRMGFTSLRSIARALRLPYESDPQPDDDIELPKQEFLDAVRMLTESGFAVERTAEEAWPHFRGWRVNYESIAYAVADRVVAPPAPWSGPRSDLAGFEIEPRRPLDRTPDQPEGTDRTRPRS